MSWVYRACIRPLLFTQDPESIHNVTLHGLAWAARHRLAAGTMAAVLASPRLPVDAFGLEFPNPIGLAAGMDKSGEALPIWETMGFGFTELGAVTWLPQPGNPRPRVFRAVRDEAVVNRMGFNNDGAEAFARRISAWRTAGRWPDHPVGVNLGKSKVTPLEDAAADYAASFGLLWPLLDFFVINVSSPNTPNLRQLQDKAALDSILAAVQRINEERAAQAAPPGARPRRKPVLVKVAPDLSFEALDEIVELCGPRQVAGIIATNTTITRPQTSDEKLQRAYAEAGGLSGRPLRQRSTEVIRHLYRQTRGTIPIVGVGGIARPEDAWEKITAGARLLQVYTGLVFEGPGLARQLVRGLTARLQEAGLKHLGDAVGTAA